MIGIKSPIRVRPGFANAATFEVLNGTHPLKTF
jgi:hypothetical protein